MEKEKVFKDSKLELFNRNTLNLSGVEKVYGANPNKIILKICGRTMGIAGSNLTIDKLDTDAGNIMVVGQIDEIKYSAEKKGILKRIFK